MWIIVNDGKGQINDLYYTGDDYSSWGIFESDRNSAKQYAKRPNTVELARVAKLIHADISEVYTDIA